MSDGRALGVKVVDPAAARAIYRVYGLKLESTVTFLNKLTPYHQEKRLDDNPENSLTYCQAQTPPVNVDWGQQQPVFASSTRTNQGQSRTYLYQLKECHIIRFTGIIDFYVFPNRITSYLLNTEMSYLAEIYLLGIVLSFFMERRGIPMLHASAVVVNGRAIAFLSSNRGGKSSLAATFMQDGCPLLTDDILPVERGDGRYYGRPGYPTMRMWPQEAQHFLGHYESLSIVHPDHSKRRIPVGPQGFGSFCDESQPLEAIYLPQRLDGANNSSEIKIERFSGVDAVIELVRNTFTPRFVQALGWQPQRLQYIMELLQQVPLRRLSYPTGFNQLERVREAVYNDIGRL